MGGKKNKGGGGKGKSKGSAEDEDMTLKMIEGFWKFYKKNCTALEIPVCPIIRDKYDAWVEEQEIPNKFHIWTELGWAGTRSIMDALRDSKYNLCTSIRLWKTFCEDEGARAVCQYLEHTKSVNFLELLDNNITPLGCEFLSKALHPK